MSGSLHDGPGREGEWSSKSSFPYWGRQAASRPVGGMGKGASAEGYKTYRTTNLRGRVATIGKRAKQMTKHARAARLQAPKTNSLSQRLTRTQKVSHGKPRGVPSACDADGRAGRWRGLGRAEQSKQACGGTARGRGVTGCAKAPDNVQHFNGS